MLSYDFPDTEHRSGNMHLSSTLSQNNVEYARLYPAMSIHVTIIRFLHILAELCKLFLGEFGGIGIK
jgi:hypothetical protein